MIHFSPDFLENFLAVVRKYMQLRGGLTQKDLSEMTGVGISTMSRFLNLKTSSVDEQLVANIIATLNIPLHEIIDGVEEDSTETFKRLVQFYKEQKSSDQQSGASQEIQGTNTDSRLRTSASINVAGRKQQMPFGENSNRTMTSTNLTLTEKLESLTTTQREYVDSFLNLSIDERELVVNLGETIFRYFRARNIKI